jgi:hypothetical protein
MTSNASCVHQYLRAVPAMGVPEAVSDFFVPDVIFHEFPNRIVPRGRVSRFADLGAAYEQAEFNSGPTEPNLVLLFRLASSRRSSSHVLTGAIG